MRLSISTSSSMIEVGLALSRQASTVFGYRHLKTSVEHLPDAILDHGADFRRAPGDRGTL